MSTTNKLTILELAAGIFGWGWLVASGLAVYYLIMAVGFGGAWRPFFVALGAGAVFKWLARGFEYNKRRVAFRGAKGQPMWTLVAFFLERLMVSLPDILLAGGGAFLMASHSWRRIVGVALVVIYFASITGTFLDGSASGLHPDDPRSFGPVFGLIAAVGGWFLGRKFQQRSRQLGLSRS